MIAIRGAGSQIAEELIGLLPAEEEVWTVPRGEMPPFTADRYLYCQGLLRPKPMAEQTASEIEESFDVNAGQVIKACDVILGGNAAARICVIGSESGFAGSYDETYAAAKDRLHRYVSGKKLRYPAQQLVCIAPSIIANAAMTLRREDQDNLEQRRMVHPKRRYLQAIEVARLVHYVLYIDLGYLSGVVLRMNGGSHLWR